MRATLRGPRLFFQPDNVDSFQNALGDIDAVTVSVSAGFVQKRKTVEKDNRSEVRWELTEGTRGPCPRAKASGRPDVCHQRI